MTIAIESWRRVWRALAPTFADQALAGLRQELAEDSPLVLQGVTLRTDPSTGDPYDPYERATVTCGCPLARLAVHEGHTTVRVVREWLAQVAVDCERGLAEEAPIRHLLNWIDQTPRDKMRVGLLEEIDREQAQRLVEEDAEDEDDQNEEG